MILYRYIKKIYILYQFILNNFKYIYIYLKKKNYLKKNKEKLFKLL